MTTELNQADREAVAKLIGAKGAMESALRRIQVLESLVADQVEFMKSLEASIGTNLHANFYASGGYKVRPIHEVLKERYTTLQSHL